MSNTRPNAAYAASLPPRQPKPNKRRPILWVLGGVAALGIVGGALANNAAPEPVVAPPAVSAPAPAVLPASCAEAFRAADERLRIQQVIIDLAGDGFDAISNGDAAKVRELATKIANRQAQLSEVDYATPYAQCKKETNQ